MSIEQRLSEAKIVPVVKINDSKKALPLAQALLRGGITAIEITFRSNQAADAMKEISEKAPELFVCAGTVLTIEDAQKALDAGAKAMISPGMDEEIIEWCIERKIPIIPGCATPSEILKCMKYGLKLLKLFPAEAVGGVTMLKALYGPYAQLKFMPTGGIFMENLRQYLALENVIACGGSFMASEKDIDSENYTEIERLCKEAIKIAK